MTRITNLIVMIVFIFGCCATTALAQDGDRWSRMVEMAEAILGDDGVIASDDRIDALIDFHVTFNRTVLGRTIPSSRVVAVKHGLRSFLASAPQRYQGDKRRASLRLIRDLAANRALFADLLSTDYSADAIEQQLLAYLERNQTLGYGDPVSIASQLQVLPVDKDIEIATAQVRMVSDRGTSGHANKAIDAGETITLSIPLRNRSDKPYRSTSAFLQTRDGFVRIDEDRADYTESRVIDGQTITFPPGMTITPHQHFTFTISPACPDGHEIAFDLLV